MKIVVCDDENNSRDTWVDAIRKVSADFDIVSIGKDEHKQLDHLFDRQQAVREDKPANWTGSVFDDADVLVVDFDLTVIKEHDSYTGERIAKLARMFSTCGYIIVMNQFPGYGFDLTLRGHYESWADLNIDAGVVGQPALWGKAKSGDFAPWYWDDIAAVTKSRIKLAAALMQTGYDQPLMSLLAMPNYAVERLSDDAFGRVAPNLTETSDFQAVTVRSVLERTSEWKDIEKLLEAQPELAARTAVARIAKWISRLLLGPQDVLIDVPHLLDRMPYLAKGGAIATNTIAATEAIAKGFEAIDDDVVEEAGFANAIAWIGKPAFWWSSIERIQRIEDLQNDFDYDSLPDIVFVEDMSAFRPREEVREFRAKFHNVYDRRYAKDFEGVPYAPRRQFAFAEHD